MDSDAKTRMIKARIGLMIKEPFFRTLALRLELVEDPKCKTSWTDGRRLGFNPESVIEAPIEDLEGIFAHHVMTCAFGHQLRRGSREEKTWNDASDIAVNAELQKAGFRLPPGSKVDPRFSTLHAEAIYAELQAEKAEQQQGKKGPEGQGKPTPGGSQSSPAGGSGAPQPGQGGEDSVPNPHGEVRDFPGEDDGDGQAASEAELAQEGHEWRTAVAQAVQAAKGAGQMSGAIERSVQSVLQPKVDWREALQRVFHARAKDDYSWRRPNRRMLHAGLYLPSLDSPRCGVLAAAIDVSGSIRQDTMDQFSAEIESAVQVINPESVLVMLFDTGIKSVLEFQPGEPIELKAKAGGGTRFDGPVNYLQEKQVTPEVLVYLTDLDSSIFPSEPEYPVVWVSTKPGNAPFGDVIFMNQ